ncbi:uncharacterized protein LOC118412103 [Branchiostoma floridae]|uniref:Uncharacterized protein LOC118412103 n=1 Tax=Branchiostoma floridae TaxID=7739 RepID=A0A9J7KUW1_BRAFL|nr:uncharacterized protein LOC118412103 [Branchiostoma floridae]
MLFYLTTKERERRMLQEFVDNLQAGIDADRTDIVREIVSAAAKCEDADEGDIQVKKLLNHLDAEEQTFLHVATKQGSVDIIRTLLSAGADPGIQDKNGDTPFDLSPSQAVTNVYNEELLQAIAQSNVGRVCQLIAAGVNINLRDSVEGRNTPLHWAASFANHEMVQCLCDRGADVNLCNSKGATALHDAVLRKDTDIVQELLEHGACPLMVGTKGSYTGKRALDLADPSSELHILLQEYSSKALANGTLAEDSSAESVEGEDPVTPDLLAHKKAPPPLLSRKDSTLSEELRIPPIPIPVNMEAEGADNSLQMDSHLVDKISHLLSATNVSAPPSPLVTDTRLHLLWPQPQRLAQGEGDPWRPSAELQVFVDQGPHQVNVTDIMALWENLQPSLQLMGLQYSLCAGPARRVPDRPVVVCLVNSRLCNRSNSYRITVSHKRVLLVGSDTCGLWYALCTFLQLLKLCHNQGIPALQITDWPQVSCRGVLIETCSGRVPKLENLLVLIERLALLKINQVHLYTKVDSPVPEPYSPSELCQIQQFCQRRHMMLVPTIDVTGDSNMDGSPLSAYVRHCKNRLRAFPACSYVNVGPVLSELILEDARQRLADGIDSATTSDSFPQLPVLDHQTPLLCVNSREGIAGYAQCLPLGCIATEYGNKADYDFQKCSKDIVEEGHGLILCPGTAAWDSIGGCPEATVSNIFNATRAAVSYGALGILVCDWSGRGHLNHQPISWPGFITTAGLSWNPSSHWDFVHANLPDLINTHVYQDRAGVMGQVIIELGRAETYLLRVSRQQRMNDNTDLPGQDGSLLYQLMSPKLLEDSVNIERLTPDNVQKAMRHIRRCNSALGKADLQCKDSCQVVSELHLTVDMLVFACKLVRALLSAGKNPGGVGLPVINVGVANLPATTRTDLANRLLSLIDRYSELWAGFNLEAGMDQSVSLLTDILTKLIPESMAAEA